MPDHGSPARSTDRRTRVEATGPTIEAALREAHRHIGPRPGSDLAMSRVVDWGAQFGGFAQAMSYWVVVEVDEATPFKN